MRYSCPHCYKSYNNRHSYMEHLNCHSNQRPHACKVCGLAFAYRSSLHNHKRIHSSVRPFTCAQCGLGFRWKNSRQIHERKCRGGNPTMVAAAPSAVPEDADTECTGSPATEPDQPESTSNCIAEVVEETRQAAAASANEISSAGQSLSELIQSANSFINIGNSLSAVKLLTSTSLESAASELLSCPHCGRTFQFQSALRIHVRACSAANSSVLSVSSPNRRLMARSPQGTRNARATDGSNQGDQAMLTDDDVDYGITMSLNGGSPASNEGVVVKVEPGRGATGSARRKPNRSSRYVSGSDAVAHSSTNGSVQSASDTSAAVVAVLQNDMTRISVEQNMLARQIEDLRRTLSVRFDAIESSVLEIKEILVTTGMAVALKQEAN